MNPKYLLYTLPLLALASCSSDEPGQGGGPAADGAAVVTADIGSPSSRAADAQWGRGDRIGISGSTGSVDYVNVPYATNDGDGTFEALNGVANGIFFQNNQPATFSAYYPYREDVTSGNTLIKASTADQTQAESFDFLYASGATGSLSEPALNFTGDASFKHSMARLVITLTAAPDGGFSESMDVVTANSTVTLDGIALEGEFDTATGIAAATGSAAELSLSFPYTVSTTTARSSLILFPQAVGEVELNIEYDGSTYSCTFTPTLAAGKRYTANISLRKTGLTVGSATITDWEEGDSFTGDATIPEPIPPIMVAGHEAIMMRKASGTPGTDDYVPALYFASCNIGAEHPEDAGKYFWFGDLIGYYAETSFNFLNKNPTIFTALKKADELMALGVIDSKYLLTPEYDAAHMQWGSGWRMPTNTEADWLVKSNVCKWEEHEIQTENGAVKGWLVTSKQTRNSIFLPKAGYRLSWYKDTTGPLYEFGSQLCMWTSKQDYYVYGIQICNHGVQICCKENGQSIRPVYEQ